MQSRASARQPRARARFRADELDALTRARRGRASSAAGRRASERRLEALLARRARRPEPGPDRRDDRR